MSEYPKFMCRPGLMEACQGVQIDHTVANDAVEEAALLEVGWFRSVQDFPEGEQPKEAVAPFLTRTAVEIVADLPAATLPELRSFLAAERSDKGRTGVIGAIEKEIRSRADA